MESFKVIHLKSDNTEKIIESIKKFMEEYDMYLDETDGNRYIFDKEGGGYSRSFIINDPVNGWTTICDEDRDLMELLCQQLSGLASCFAVLIGVFKKMLFYTTYNDGEQTGQYMSTLDYYEYPVDDDVIDRYTGDAVVFEGIVDSEAVEGIEKVIEGCRDKSIKPMDGYENMEVFLGITPSGEDNTGEGEGDKEDELPEEPINPENIFYVDFKNINVRTDSCEGVVEAIIKIAGDMGYKKADEFTCEDGKKGLFKRIFNSISESRRLHFHISPSVGGWVTFVGEVEVLYGGNPSEWEFLNIDDRMSEILSCDVIYLAADSEKWGFRLLKKGNTVYEYSSINVYDEEDEELQNVDIMEEVSLNEIFNREINDARDVDEALKKFCEALGIRNYKINIPMDYTEDEYSKNVLDLLPDGKEFKNLKFVKEK